MKEFNINDCVLVGHAIDTGELSPADFESWMEFWEDYMDESTAKQCPQWNDDAVGAHVVDANGKFYITPRPNDENFEMGQTNDVEADGRLFLVPKQFLASVGISDSVKKSGGILLWWKIKEANEDLCDYISRQNPQAFVEKCKKEYYK